MYCVCQTLLELPECVYVCVCCLPGGVAVWKVLKHDEGEQLVVQVLRLLCWRIKTSTLAKGPFLRLRSGIRALGSGLWAMGYGLWALDKYLVIRC